MRNAEYRTAQGSVESPACRVGPSARARNYRSCLHRPVASICKQYSAFRIPHSLIVRSTANHPFAPRGKPRGGGLSWERMRSAEYAMRNAEYRTAQGSVESPACRVGPSARARNYRSCLHRPVASICKQYSAFRIPHSLIVRSTANHPFAPRGKPRGGGLFWERMRSAECGMRNAEYRAAQRQRGIAGLSCWSIPPPGARNYRSCLHRPVASICKQYSAFRIPHSLIVRSTANHPFAPCGKPRGGGLFWERMRSAECGMRNAEYRAAQRQRGIAGLSCWSIPPPGARNYRSCLHRPVASICKQYSAFRIPWWLNGRCTPHSSVSGLAPGGGVFADGGVPSEAPRN